MTDALGVWVGGERVGTFERRDTGASRFTYDEAWSGPPLSVSLPVRAAPYEGGPAHAFFAGLLPEGGAREAVCTRLGISVDNGFELLARIGGECAGALSIAPEAPIPEDASYERLSTERIEKLLIDEARSALFVGGATTRLSLAGAQDKLPVFVHDGGIHVPVSAEPTTHILKLPNRRFPHLCVNEAFTMAAAAAVGLTVPGVELVTELSQAYLLVGRYDRSVGGDGWTVRRLHQEDTCQALGRPPERKYQQEGGPSLVEVVGLIREHAVQPLSATLRLLDWLAFNVVAGNSDAHGKNVSLLYRGPRPELAPFYDLVSTRAYDRIDRHLAMAVGGQSDPDLVARKHFEGLAAELGVASRVVLGRVAAVAGACESTIDDVASRFERDHGAQPVLQTLPQAFAKRARALLRRLG